MSFTLPAVPTGTAFTDVRRCPEERQCTANNVMQLQYVNNFLEQVKHKASFYQFRGIERQVWRNWPSISAFFDEHGWEEIDFICSDWTEGEDETYYLGYDKMPRAGRPRNCRGGFFAVDDDEGFMVIGGFNARGHITIP